MKNYNVREFLGDIICIDGRNIAYKLYDTEGYFEAKGFRQEEIENLQSEVYDIINQIMALKQACYIFRRTSYCLGCSDALFELKTRLIKELKEKYDFEFDDDFVEHYGFSDEEYGKLIQTI